MDKKRGMKKILLAGVLALFLIVLIGNVAAVCCEKTKNGGICLDVGGSQYCNDAFRIDDTACDSTAYCSSGTCVNNRAGTCVASTSAACDSSLGGYWYDERIEDIDDCRPGCCLIGDGAAFVGRVTCNAMSAFYGVESDFRASIADEATCLASAGPTTKGACVFQADNGRSCTIETREKCIESDREFHAGLLCSAPQLGTICIMSEETTCVEGKNEVYFVDSCGNPANVYDASKVDDVPYWTDMIQDTASNEICGAGESNALNPDCGNCNYLLGSTCGEARGATYGDYICRDLSCRDKDGNPRQHGESWCNQPITDFENAKPGELSYMLYCYDGEVQWELCGNQRTGLCKENVEGLANCLFNRWQDCLLQNNSRDCENTEKRDCRVKENLIRKLSDGNNITLLDTDTGDYISAMCVPKYPPGFNFDDADVNIQGVRPALTPVEVCSFGSVSATSGYRAGIFTGANWNDIDGKCFADCLEECGEAWDVFESTCQTNCFRRDCGKSEAFKDEDKGGTDSVLDLGEVSLEEDWVDEQKNICISIGDCGVKENYLGGESYKAWKDLFEGENVRVSEIVGADSHV